MGPSLVNIAWITPEERKDLWHLAMQFDRTPRAIRERESKAVKQAKRALYELRRKQKPPSDQETPWDWFDKEGDWRDILEPHGWTSNGDHWTRPGKSFGTSAAITTSTSGAEVLCVFSSNAGPLAPGGGEAHRTVGKFNAFALLNHGGDRKEAAKAIARMMQEVGAR